MYCNVTAILHMQYNVFNDTKIVCTDINTDTHIYAQAYSYLKTLKLIKCKRKMKNGIPCVCGVLLSLFLFCLDPFTPHLIEKDPQEMKKELKQSDSQNKPS